MVNRKVTRAGLLAYAAFCREWIQLKGFPGLALSRSGSIAQLFILDSTDEGGCEPGDLLACAQVAESLAYGNF